MVGVATGGMVIAATGIGLAYWSSQGSGTGTATTGTATISLPTTPATVSGLYPGASITNVQVTLTNTSPAASVLLKTLNAGTTTVDSGHSGCTNAGVSFSANSIPTTVISANGGTITVTGTVAMSTTAPNACQGATFTIPITATAQAG